MARLLDRLTRVLGAGFSTEGIQVKNSPVTHAGRPKKYRSRRLTVDTYQQHALTRRSNSASRPFRLRHAPRGKSSNLLCTHSHAWFDGSQTPPGGVPNALTATIEHDGVAVASVTFVFAGSLGLAVEKNFPQEMRLLRQRHGNLLCEMTSFVLDRQKKSRRMVAGLLHIVYLYARQSKQMEGLLIQIKPRHADLFEKAFGFRKLSERNGSTLMYVTFSHIRQQISRFGGQPQSIAPGVGIYGYFFPVTDEPGLLFRFLKHLGAGNATDG